MLDLMPYPFAAEGAEKVHKGLRLDGVCVDNYSLDIWQISVVLQRAHVQACFLAQLCDARSVVVCEHAVGQNSIRHIWESHQVYLKHLQGSAQSTTVREGSTAFSIEVHSSASSLCNLCHTSSLENPGAFRTSKVITPSTVLCRQDH